MIIGAIASALAPDFLFLVVARLVLGLGIGGDYPVSAVFMSEYSNRKDRGRLVGLVFSMQALGLIVGPLVALLLLSSGIGDSLTWRILWAWAPFPPPQSSTSVHGCLSPPVIWRKCKANMGAAGELEQFSEGVITEPARRNRSTSHAARRLPHRSSHVEVAPRHRWSVVPLRLRLLRQHPSLPAILKEVDTTASLETKLLWSLGMFVIFAVPGYLLAVKQMDRIGHRRLQFIGFSVMAVCFVVLAAVPSVHRAGGTVLGHPGNQLLLHSVRAEHDDIRSAV